MIFWGCCMLGQMISTLGISMSAETGLYTIRNDFLANSSFIIKLGIVENGSVYLKEGVLEYCSRMCKLFFGVFFCVNVYARAVDDFIRYFGLLYPIALGGDTAKSAGCADCGLRRAVHSLRLFTNSFL